MDVPVIEIAGFSYLSNQFFQIHLPIFKRVSPAYYSAEGFSFKPLPMSTYFLIPS